ncbi:arginine/ornithine antiporter arcD [Vibrio sp. JCM 19236]|nr:arginine/ornithine antiporter arcD [Vibrio sp. JCM 19236]
MGGLAIARVPYVRWVKWVMPLIGILTVFCMAVLSIGALIYLETDTFSKKPPTGGFLRSEVKGYGANYQLSAISYQLSAISYQLSAISYQLSAISYQLSAISYQLSAIRVSVGLGSRASTPNRPSRPSSRQAFSRDLPVYMLSNSTQYRSRIFAMQISLECQPSGRHSGIFHRKAPKPTR